MPLSDEESIDRVNPFVQHDFFMPGTSRQFIDFAPHVEPAEEPAQEEYVSPTRDYGVMVAGRIGKRGNCVLSRGLYPGRNIQYEDDPSVRPKSVENKNNPNGHDRKKTMNNFLGMLILLLLVVIL